MKINKRSIIAMIIFLLILLVVILVYGKKDDKSSNETPVDEYAEYQKNREREGQSANDAVAQIVEDLNEYTTIQGIIEQFNENVKYLNATAADLDLIVNPGEEASVVAEYKQKGLKYIENVLAPNYKEKYSVNQTYISNLLSQYAKKKYTISNIYVVYDSEYINTYFVYGNYEGMQFNFVIVLDRYRNTYQMYLNNYFTEQGYSSKDIKTMKTLNVTSVEANDNNSFQYKNVEKEQTIGTYYDEFIKTVRNNPDQAYNMLDSEYRSKRFKSKEEFSKYIAGLPTDTMSKMATYTTTNGNGYTEYVCKDLLGNIFIFKVAGAMKYSVILDTYTVNILAYQNEYSGADTSKKAELSLNRFFECINNKNYEKAYSYLNASFRDKEFGSVEAFKNYVQSNWFSVNKFSIGNIDEGVNGTYSAYGTLSDYADEGSFNAGAINKTFYIRLGSSYSDFEVSFGK